MTHQREYDKITNIISRWPGDKSLWLHLYGKAGVGKKYLLHHLMTKKLRRYPLLFRYNFSLFPYYSWFLVRKLVYFIIQTHQEGFRDFLKQFPLKLKNLILQSLIEETSGEKKFITGNTWDYNLLYQLMVFFAQKGPHVVVLENVFEESNKHIKMLFKVLEYSRDIPLLIISTGKNDLPLGYLDDSRFQFSIGKRSIREAEGLISGYSKTAPIVTRLITNRLYLKSGGNPQKIKFMLETFYKPLANAAGETEKIAALQKIRPASALDEIFKRLCGDLPKEIMDIFSFLSRLDDPLPKNLFLKIIKLYNYDRKDYQSWLDKAFIGEEKYLKHAYVLITWQPWKSFLRMNTSIKRIKRILEFLKTALKPGKLALPLLLSNYYFDIGDLSNALQFAYSEAQLLEKFGELQRALERYSFLRRNLSRLSQSPVLRRDVLNGMANIQIKLGLYQNSYESLRELRECYKPVQRQKWINVSLQMANVLLQMDAFSEAGYLITELKIKPSVSPNAYVFSKILMGELEQNFGHSTVALRYYQKALKILPQVDDEELMMRLYGILKNFYSGLEEEDKQIDLIRLVCKYLPQDSRNRPILQLELITSLVKKQDFEAALPLTVDLYRNYKTNITPRMAAEIRLFLSEIYGYYGKWYLARSYLKGIYNTPILISNLRIHVRVMFNLGIVEKELGHYGSALELLKGALEICDSKSLFRLAYQIKVHLGHICLLSHNLIRARDYLMEALNWAEENQDEELQILATLFLASYSLLHNKLKSAKNYLEKAEPLINLFSNTIDRLNYFYYFVMYNLQAGKLDIAYTQVKIWEKESRGIVKFENLSIWLSGKIMLQKGKYSQAQTKLDSALQRSIRYRLPYLGFHVLRDLAELAKCQKRSQEFRDYTARAAHAFQTLLEGVGDEILQRQIKESSEFEVLLDLVDLGID